MATDAERWRGAARPADRRFHVVGIGASAGGLDALRALFREAPQDTGMAWVIVVHLSPEHESHLHDLLQPDCRMPVQQVTETVAPQPNHVYVIPPNANLESIDTHLRLSALEERRLERAPIDHFLRTLAATHDGEPIGVVLTGAGSDGALGLRRIKESGGLTIAQHPDEAEYDSMPRSAIATGMVDLVLPLREIAHEILRFCRTQPQLPATEDSDTLPPPAQEALDRVVAEVRLRTGQDFAMYTPATLLRRIGRRMQLWHVETLDAYLDVLRTQPAEPRALADDLLLKVSEFFREREIFELLETRLLPELFERKAGFDDRLRIWSIGCSTGEEAYSLAMLLLEISGRRETRPQLQVFASDLSSEALHSARLGLYPHEVAATVPPHRLERFFERELGRYRVRREVRDLVVFAEHDLFGDPPYAHLDLILCRNLFRDLQPDVRRGVLNLFHYALEPHGMLLVGPQDEIDEPHLFMPDDKASRLYRRKYGPRTLQFPSSVRPFQSSAGRPPTRANDFAEIHRSVAERYSPPSVLVDASDRIVHYSARAGRYVHIPGGEPTHDLLRVVGEPLRSELRTALHLVRHDQKPFSSRPIAMRTDGTRRSVTLHVEPVPDVAGALLIVFEERSDREATAAGGAESRNDLAARLERELERANARLLQALDQQEALASQFSQVARDRANDDLQSVMEELQNSRQALQSVNEELLTLDEENRRRLEELAEISSDLQRLLESTGVATLFVDRDLRIARFTPQIGELIHMRHTDIGRPLSDLTHSLRYDAIESDVRYVFEHPAPLDREIQAENGAWYLMRILPYRPEYPRLDGAVVSFIDITARRQAEENLREADRRKDEFLAVLAHELRNPLAPISAGIEVLKTAGSNPGVVAQVAATMARQTQQLVRLVDDLLEVSRISGGKLHLKKSPVQLADVMRDAVATSKPLIERLGHELAVVLPAEPVVLDADGPRLTQVLANLLNNAARYTLREGRIEVGAERRDGTAIVKVRDNGIGIARHAMPRVFEMFYQDRDQRVARNSGLGIGLTLAKSLVEMHGGSIDVESSGPNRGSTFTIRLPIAVGASTVPEEHRHAPSAGDHRVLIVDDNTDAAETLCMLVKSLGGNEVQTASSGAEALETARELQPDVVLLDLMMPGMDGYEVARRMRQESWGRDAKIVAVTGWGQEEHRRRTREAGFDQHLTKPANIEALESLLAEAPTRQRAQPMHQPGL
jgi:two-component system CheB/CheR fusion protein